MSLANESEQRKRNHKNVIFRLRIQSRCWQVWRGGDKPAERHFQRGRNRVTTLILEDSIEAAARQSAILGDVNVTLDLLLLRESLQRRRLSESVPANSQIAFTAD